MISINTLGYATEAFLFIYLGLGVFSMDQETFNLTFIILTILGGFVARALAVFIPIGIYAAFKKCKISLNLKQLLIIWFSGLIRGAIAFALSQQIDIAIAPHKKRMVSITLMVVMITTIVLGGLMAAFAKLIGLKVESVSHHKATVILSKGQSAAHRKDASGFSKKWRYFDDHYIKKIFGGDMHNDQEEARALE